MAPSSWLTELQRKSRRRARPMRRFEPLEERHLLASGLMFRGPEPVVAVGELADVLAADLNGDDRLDLIVADRQSDQLDVALGEEAEAKVFRPAEKFSALKGITSMAAADVDRDGYVDLLVATRMGDHTGAMSWLRNLGVDADQWLGWGEPDPISTHEGNGQFVVDDSDADGMVDLAVVDAARLTVRRGLGNGQFDAPIGYLQEAGTRSLIASDLDIDGDLDLAVVNAKTAEVTLLLGSGDGTFEAHDQRYSAGLGGGTQGADPWTITAGDVDLDGSLDLITTSPITR